MKLEHFLTPYTKISSKWIKYLNIRSETVKVLEENIGSTFFDIHHSKILCDPPPRVMEIKTEVNKWRFNQFIPKQISPGCPLEGLMSRLKPDAKS